VTPREDAPRDGEAGSAMVEFIGASVLLLLPLVYLMLTVFRVQAGAFAVTQAARSVGRVYAAQGDTDAARELVAAAAAVAVGDQGLPDTVAVAYAAAGVPCAAAVATPPPLAAGQPVAVCVHEQVPLPFASGPLFRRLGASVGVTGRFVVTPEPYREGR
jgi:Flp pilus assembly protein TadG